MKTWTHYMTDRRGVVAYLRKKDWIAATMQINPESGECGPLKSVSTTSWDVIVRPMASIAHTRMWKRIRRDERTALASFRLNGRTKK